MDHSKTARLVGGINITGGKTDSVFFIEDPILGSPVQLSSIALCHKDKIQLNWSTAGWLVKVHIRQAITKSGFRIQEESENEHQVNMQLYGRPWHCSGAEGVRSRQLVARISEVMLQQGWALTDAINTSPYHLILCCMCAFRQGWCLTAILGRRWSHLNPQNQTLTSTAPPQQAQTSTVISMTPATTTTNNHMIETLDEELLILQKKNAIIELQNKRASLMELTPAAYNPSYNPKYPVM